ncbi:MAG: VCBS repeat-containing protein, partial [Bacteroidales bacterium]
MKKPSLLLILTVFLSSVHMIKAQFPTFTRIDTSVICTAGGYTLDGAFGDFNNDGLDDLLILSANHEPEPNFHMLFVNEGNWNFRQIMEDPVVESSTLQGSHGANWGDYDNDGDLDLFVASFYNSNNLLFTNNGDGSFTQVLNGSIVNDGGDSGPATWIDIENDGYIDLYVSNHSKQNNFLYHNNGDGTFTRFTSGQLVNFSLFLDQGMSSVDIDNDRDNDIFGYAPLERNYLYLNDGYGNFSLVDRGVITDNDYEAFTCGWGDYDNNGCLDLFTGTYNVNPSYELVGEYDILYHNNGDGTFTVVTGIEPVSEIIGTDEGCWADFDNDGYLDLFTYAIWGANNKLYKNNGDGTFTKLDIPAFTDDTSGRASLADMNNDGFIDIFISRGYMKYGPTENLIYANNGNSNSWLTVKLIGMVSNKDAFGARVKAKATIGGSQVWQVR